MSRQLRVRNLFPTVGTAQCIRVPGRIFRGLPNPDKIVELYPQDQTPAGDDAEGNDDPNTLSQANDPYAERQPFYKPRGGELQLNVGLGLMSNVDGPRTPIFDNAAGRVGDTLEQRNQFREFARLQIGNTGAAGYRNWYRVSDYFLWRHQPSLKKMAERRGDGVMIEVWRNNPAKPSVSDATNDGW
jgi:hypothetical protein